MFGHVLLPVAVTHNPNADDAVALAARLAGDDGKITVLSVVEPIPVYVDQQIPAEIRADSLAHAKSEMDRVAAGHPRAEAKVLEGHAANTILEFAEGAGVDCIVIASHKPGLQDYLIGSTAARVVRHAQCSVHVVR